MSIDAVRFYVNVVLPLCNVRSCYVAIKHYLIVASHEANYRDNLTTCESSVVSSELPREDGPTYPDQGAPRRRPSTHTLAETWSDFCRVLMPDFGVCRRHRQATLRR